MPCTVGSEVPELAVYSRLSVSVERGEGIRVWDTNGREYLDFYGGHAVSALGYGHVTVTAAIQDQAAQLSFQSNAVGSSVRDHAIRALIASAPDGLDQAFLVNSGAEANENALRLAFLTTGRTRVASLRGGFHGRTAAAGAVTDGNAKWYAFPRAPFDVDWVTPESMEELEAAIGPDTAAFIFEPVQGVAGAVDLSPAFVQHAEALCRERGVCLIADEVQTGVGRTGTMWAIEQLGVRPDILTAAKGLGNGFPVGAVLCSNRVAESVGIGTLGTTFGGAPMACAVMSAVLEAVGAHGFLDRVQRSAALLRETVEAAGVTRVSGRGLLMGLHLDQPAAGVRQELLARGFITGDAKNPNVVRLLPPLILDSASIDMFGRALAEVLA